MARLKKIIEDARNKKLLEDEEAPSESPYDMEDTDDEESQDNEDDTTAESDDTAESDMSDVDGADKANTDAGMSEDPTDGAPTPEDSEDDDTVENFDDLDKTIEEMVGITEIQHTTSSSIIDFEDGGQIMYVQPIVSVQSGTLNKIIALIISDVENSYAHQRDEITGKDLNNTKYWKSIKTLVSTMVRSQLTKSDNVDGLIDEVKQVFKVLEVK